MRSQECSERGKVRARGVSAKCRILRSRIQPRERRFTESRAGCPEFGAGDEPAALEEALKDGPRVTEYAVLGKIYRSSKKSGLKMKLPVDVDGRSIDPNLTTYSVELTTKILTRGSPSYMYFDQARAIRE